MLTAEQVERLLKELREKRDEGKAGIRHHSNRSLIEQSRGAARAYAEAIRLIEAMQREEPKR